MRKFLYAIFHSSLFWMIITGLLCFFINIGINISIAYLWLFLIDKLSLLSESLLFLNYFIILILFFYNYFLLRKLIILWVFEWQFPFQNFSIYKERQAYLAYLKLRLRNFIRVIELLLDSNNNISKKENNDIESFLSLFGEELNIYDQLYNCVNNNSNNNLVRYKMSRCQIKYYNLLKSINNTLNENDTKNDLLNLKQNINNFSNKIINDNSLPDKQNSLNQLNILLNEFLNTISKYDWNNYTYMSPSYLYNLIFNDTFGSLSLYSLQFKKKIEEYQYEENFTPQGKIHYTLLINKQRANNNNNKKENNLISENDDENNDGTLLIFCLPNGGCYELIPKLKIDFYLNNGFSFLCWNYKGYGYSKGRANFSNVKTDVLELYDIIVNNPKYNFKKICVMGHSIGGVAACYLAKNRNIDLLICDRNFCDMTRLVNNFYCGKCLSCLIKYLFIGQTDNISNFYNYNNESKIKNGFAKLKYNNEEKNSNSNNVNSIIIYSPVDMLILNDCTIKSGVARYIIKNYIIYKNKENNQIIKGQENLLDIVFNKNNKIRFINAFSEMIHSYYDNYDLNSADDIILQIHNNENINNGKSNENSNPTKSITKAESDFLFSFFDNFFGVCCDNLNFLSMNKMSLRRETIFIDNFFNNLLIWGVQGGDSEDEEYYEFYSYRGKKILKEAYNILYKFSLKKNETKINKTKIETIVNLISEDFKKIIDVMDNLDIILPGNENNKIITKENTENINNIEGKNSLKEKLIENNEEKVEISSNNNSIINTNSNINKDGISFKNDIFYNKLNSIKGNIKLFKTISGHNGLLRVDEREQFFTFLLSTGIIGY